VNVLDADSAQIGRFFAAQERRVLSFLGYSDSGYEDPAAMLEQAARVLDEFDARNTLVNIGATPGGIGAVYELAQRRGFMTTGIVSTQARESGVPLSPFVEVVLFVADASWGGLLPGSTRLSPTSQAIVDHSDIIVAIGGGAVARDELDAARRTGKPARFIAAEMNHAAALAAAARKGLPPPSDFRGAAGARFGAATPP
jgi:predicted Rossmann-fold nucleotide-binding protein